MKILFLFSLLSFVLISESNAQTIPTRKTGLWSLSMNLDGGSRPAGKQCVDATTDQAMMKAGTDMGASMGMNCKKMESKKEGEKFIVETDCMMKNVHMVSSTVFEGDFNSEYTSTMSAKYDPPFMGQSDMNVVTKAKYEGACQAGQIPGDIILPNGMKINVNEMGKKK